MTEPEKALQRVLEIREELSERAEGLLTRCDRLRAALDAFEEAVERTREPGVLYDFELPEGIWG